MPPKRQLETYRRGSRSLSFWRRNPQRTSKRDISRAFNIKGNDKIKLKALLRDLIDEGLIERRGKRLAEPGALPPVGVIDIVTRDRQGGLLGTPATWNEGDLGKPPVIEISRNNRAKGKTAGVGDRVLARLTRMGNAHRYSANVIRIIPKADNETLGIIRFRDNAVRLEPASRKASELEIPRDMLGDAQDGDLVVVETIRGTKYGLKKARVTSVIGSYRSEKAISLIAIHANEIPHVFPENVHGEAKQAKPVQQGKA